jgi:DNA-binding PadR family transcriptional regulator
MFRNFFIGFVRIHILYHASKGPVYGLWLIEELARHGYRLSPGTLYPILSKLERKGLLKSTKKVVAGKVRKYYTSTKKGDRALSEIKQKVRELVREIIDEDQR